MAALGWNTTVRPWVVATKTLLPHRSINFDGAPASRRPAAALVALGLAAVAVAGAGTAYAYQQTTGTGSNSSTGATASAVTLHATATITAGTPLYPGAPAATLNVTVDNSAGTQAIKIAGVALDSNRTITASNALGTCTSFSFTVAPPSNWAGFTVAAGATSTQPVTGAVTMVSADNGCQGATFTIPVTLTGQV
ncbi:MAG: hypothetical protein QOC82_440 [Frankiaceae bacterium]|jgi:hypothetical protein|nr:hypothetical protein [Frankiaceae bacterium]